MCGIIYGFDRTQHLFAMARHFNIFKNNVFVIIPKMSTVHIHIRGLNCI